MGFNSITGPRVDRLTFARKQTADGDTTPRVRIEVFKRPIDALDLLQRSKRQSNYPLDPHQYPKLETDDLDVIGVTATLLEEETASKINYKCLKRMKLYGG
ncbi:unnamed protein product [Fusarium graminearum]|uniref:Chromosome 1, complete genome n=1 Tax=Gibberella zeae (strain ATCC MYA-4620 / CBS 123657 / FGSC 9075 / NRRL 31084 / PH-1) TaxID=229533 RepID=I1S5E4_GIBZE|nr:hypothetical protein FGSG_12062 [Fusarium graminearum PH-1]ESU07422.1 hypothetical protein FGSG_12062 [Fusarium graminearum PH-1]CEF74263.1 unnamed protein product [Fusarium graminearum]CZS77531.1 unnamed protein product [Fusarium graminearum]|eukprot:XP_011317907.1 hypothetical protein FGSG_12062 [Fusarium graminearum PH-1]